LFVSIIFSFAHFGYAFILLRAKQIQLDNQYIILLYVLFYIVYTLFSIPTGIASDKIGRKPIIISGNILFLITCVGLVFSTSVLLLLIMFVLYGLFYAMIDGVQRAFVVDLSAHQLKTTALGTYHTAVGLAALPAGLLLGIIWDKLSPEVMFIYSLCLRLFALMVFVFVKKKEKKN
jgi:MFS family permease